MVKFISPEKLVTVEQVAVTTGEIAGRRFRLEEETQEERKLASVEFEGKTRSLKPKGSSHPKPREKSLGSFPLSREDKEELDEVKNLFQNAKPKRRKKSPRKNLPSPKKRPLSNNPKPSLAMEKLDEELDEFPTAPHLKTPSLPPIAPTPPKRPVPRKMEAPKIHPQKPLPKPFGQQKAKKSISGVRSAQQSPSRPVHNPPRPPSPNPPPPTPRQRVQQQQRRAQPTRQPTPAPSHPSPSRRPRQSSVSQTPARRQGSHRIPAQSRTPMPPLTPRRPFTGTKALKAVKRASKSPIWLGGILVFVVLVVAVISGLFYVKSRSTDREKKQRDKAYSLMTRGDMQGLRGSTIIFSKLNKDPKALEGRALALVLLSMEFGLPKNPAKKAVSLIVGQKSARATAARIGLAVLGGSIGSALDLADDAVGQWSKSSWIFYMRGLALMVKGSWEAAANNLRHALRLRNPPSVWINIALARLWILGENPKRVRAPLAALETNVSKNPEVTLLRVRHRLLQCRHRQGCPCATLKTLLPSIEGRSIQTWTTYHKSWAHLVATRVHLCLRNQREAEKRLQQLKNEPGPQQADFHEAAAEALLALQRQPKAEARLKALKKLYPKRSRTLLLLARAYLEADHPKKALRELATINSRSRGPRWYQYHARVLLKQEKLHDALTTIESGLKISPNNLPLKIIKVRVLQISGRMTSAKNLAKRLFQNQPQNIGVLLASGEVLEKQGKLVLAEARLKAALEHDPNNPKAHSAMGRILKKRGQWDRALVHFKRAASIQPSSLSNWLKLGDLAFNQGRYDAARSPYEQVIKRNANHPGALVRLARLHVVTGYFQNAYTLLRKVPEKERSPLWRLTNGWAHLREGNYNNADKNLKGLKSPSLGAQAKALLALSSIYQLQYRRADLILARLSRRSKNNPLVGLTRGRLWLSKRKARRALRYFHSARKACRKSHCSPRLAAIIRAYRGRAYYLTASSRRAYQEFNKALEIDPYCGIAYHLHGICLYEEEKEERAFQNLSKGLSLDRGYAEAHYYIGEIYRNRRQRSKAAEHFRSYLKYRRYGDLVSAARVGLSAVD